MFASRAGHVEAVKLLLQNGADVFAKDRRLGQNAVHPAAINGHAGVVDALLDHNPLVLNATDRHGCTAVHLAFAGGKYAILDQLTRRLEEYRHEAKDLFRQEDYRGNSAVTLAARSGQVGLVQKLIPFASTRQIFKAQSEAATLPTKTREHKLARWQIQHDLFIHLIALHQDWPLSR